MNESDTLNLNLKFEEINIFNKTKGSFEIIANYPNPFNSKTKIKIFSIAETEIEIKIYNIMGQPVKSIKNKVVPGYNTISWDANDEAGYSVPSGIYFYAISDSKCRKIKKMTLLR